MSTLSFSHEQLVHRAKLGAEDFEVINTRRRAHNRLGFAYQLAFVRLTNRFPTQQPFEVVEDILTFISLQVDISADLIQGYQYRRETITEHQPQIVDYLELRRFGETESNLLKQFLFEEASRLEQPGPLLTKAKQFLQDQSILQPADATLRRLIGNQRTQARDYIFQRLTEALPSEMLKTLDALLQVEESRISSFQSLKQPPGTASPPAMNRLVKKLERIQTTGVLAVDLTWLNNNYQRALTRYAQRCSADRLRRLQTNHRYAVLTCFLRQVYQDTIDHMVDMHDKLMTGIYNRAQTEIDEETKRRRKMLRTSLLTLQTLGQLILDETVADTDLRQVLFSQVNKDDLTAQIEAVDTWLNGKYGHVFNLVTQRFSYVRQFAPALLEHLEFNLEEGSQSSLIKGIEVLRDLNEEKKRKLPDDAPLGFIPKKLRPFVEADDGALSKRAWECALLTVIRDEIKAGNVFVGDSKRFGRFDDFFILDTKWQAMRKDFFKRAGLPDQAKDVPDYLTQRLNRAYDEFLAQLPDNTYASIGENGWQLSVDPTEKLDTLTKQKLADLKDWLADNLRVIKLPELLIEVDNDLAFTQHFLLPNHPETREAQDVCTILASVMAHGCNIGPFTMARLTQGVSYHQIKNITDWQLSEETQRQALAQLVNAIGQLDVSQTWGAGKTSSSDAQRFRFNRRVLQRTYSHKLNDYALEFYSFIADNYAPFYRVAAAHVVGQITTKESV